MFSLFKNIIGNLFNFSWTKNIYNNSVYTNADKNKQALILEILDADINT